MINPSIKAILFDMDGVLVDARDWHYHALNEALGHFGYSINLDAHLSTYDGLPTKIKLNALSKIYRLPHALHPLINQLKQKYTSQYMHKYCKPTFNHRFALARLSKDYKIAVCSNSIRTTIDTMMSLSGLDSYIDLILSNEDVQNSKPHPEIYLRAMKELDVEPHECLIVEDSDHGVQAALAAGGHLHKVSEAQDLNYFSIYSQIMNIK